MLAVSASDCRTCKARAQQLQAMRAAGGDIEGDFVQRITGAHYVDLPDQPTVTINVEHGRFTMFNKAGGDPIEVEPNSFTANVTVQREGERWVVAQNTIIDD